MSVMQCHQCDEPTDTDIDPDGWVGDAYFCPACQSRHDMVETYEIISRQHEFVAVRGLI